jgi:hypothetical protein
MERFDTEIELSIPELVDEVEWIVETAANQDAL